MKKIMKFLAVLLMVFGLMSHSAVALASGLDYDPATFKSDKDRSEWTIGVVTKDNTSAWFMRMEDGIEQFRKDTGINVISRGPASPDAASQVQVIEDLIAQGVDALLVVPLDPQALESTLKNALDQGIVVITHEASNQENTLYDVEAFTSDMFGSTIMDELANAMDKKGKYAMMVGYTTSTTHMEYANAQHERQEEEYPEMELINGEVPSAESEESINTAYEKAREILSVNPDLRGFTGVASTDCPGIANAVEELGLQEQVAIVGVGTPNEFRPYIESGTINKLLLWDPADAGYAMLQTAVKVLNGELIENESDLGVTGYEKVEVSEKTNRIIIGNAPLIIDSENIGDYDF
ncbi:autoinducer 2 ABC transporter substrate-binding protein [Falseniella ignava]|uniref:Periplasmic binding protein domain-containing protein n=1 Tax=Falseniella ignava CCUG 37419 TaxID=883112 RepID=K1LUI5_9LACT|nr:autoinducer 2 ABC transporter substrate-binding protein [Falseniella ignava]EKB55792.1 hypothetical protein HMPREF9707_00979 [Falseniella ignava CCUG 37419]